MSTLGYSLYLRPKIIFNCAGLSRKRKDRNIGFESEAGLCLVHD